MIGVREEGNLYKIELSESQTNPAGFSVPPGRQQISPREPRFQAKAVVYPVGQKNLLDCASIRTGLVTHDQANFI